MREPWPTWLRSGQMTWDQFEGQLDNPVMEVGRRP